MTTRQIALFDQTTSVLPGIVSSEWTPLLVYPSDAELAAHVAFISALKSTYSPMDE